MGLLDDVLDLFCSMNRLLIIRYPEEGEPYSILSVKNLILFISLWTFFGGKEVDMPQWV